MTKKNIIVSEMEEEPLEIKEDLTESEENGNKKQKKPGRIARLRAYISNVNNNRKIAKQFKKDQKSVLFEEEHKTDKEKHVKDNRRLDQYLNSIENQLDKVDEQNKMLLFYLTTVKENNEALLNQINVLTKNNQQLLKHIEGSRRREKIAKIFGITSSILAIGLTVWKILQAAGVL